MPRTAIVFDLDGTLVDSAPDLAAATDHVLATHGRQPVGLEMVRHLVGDGARALLMRGFEATGSALDDVALDAAVVEFLAYYGPNIARRTRPFPGVVEGLGRLRARGFQLGVCTNKKEGLSRDLLAQLDLTRFFDAIVGGDSLPVRKPDRGHILGTLKAMGAAPGNAVMIGDSINDVLAAHAAKVPVVAVTFGYTRIPAAELGANILIDRFDELDAAIEHLG